MLRTGNFFRLKINQSFPFAATVSRMGRWSSCLCIVYFAEKWFLGFSILPDSRPVNNLRKPRTLNITPRHCAPIGLISGPFENIKPLICIMMWTERTNGKNEQGKCTYVNRKINFAPRYHWSAIPWTGNFFRLKINQSFPFAATASRTGRWSSCPCIVYYRSAIRWIWKCKITSPYRNVKAIAHTSI